MTSDPAHLMALALLEKFRKLELPVVCADCMQPLQKWEVEDLRGRCWPCYRAFRERYRRAYGEDPLTHGPEQR